MKSKLIKNILYFTKIFFILLLSFSLFSVIMSTLPSKKIKENITKSSYKLSEQGLYPNSIINIKGNFYDNFTDALILSQIYLHDPQKPLKSAFENKIPWYSMDFVETLNKLVKNEELYFPNYSRYWHGSTFIYRPFFIVADYNTVRWIIYAISSLLIILLSVNLNKHIGLSNTVFAISGLFFVNFYITQFSMQFINVFLIAFMASLFILKWKDKPLRNILQIFFIAGCFTAYLDLLTAPLVSLGFPLIIFTLIANTKKDFKIIKAIKNTVSISLLWAFGFALTWFSKLVLSTIFTEDNVIKDAFNNFLSRTGTNTAEKDFSRFDVIIENLDFVNFNNLLWLAIPMLLFVIIAFNKKGIKVSVVLLLISLMPFLWYILASNHSYVHDWYTFRLLSVSIICWLLILNNLISKQKLQNISINIIKIFTKLNPQKQTT